MLQDPLFLLTAAAVFAVLIILMIGVVGFALGGEFNRKHANRLMRLRVIAQAVAVVLIVTFVVVRQGG